MSVSEQPVVNGPMSYPSSATVDSAVLSSPSARQQPVNDQNRNRRPLIGQGAAMNAADMPPPAANLAALSQNVAAPAPMGRPIVKGNCLL